MKTPKLVMMKAKDLIPYELNSKKHPPEQVAKIAQSIRRFGFDVPIVVDRHNVIIKGHGRQLGAMEIDPEYMVPVLVRDDLTPEQVKAARAADNRVALSDIDPDILRKELAEIQDIDLLDGIFDGKELDFLDADLGTVNDGAFVNDMDSTLADQKADLERRSEEAAAKRISLAKAFGFKDVPGNGQLVLTNLMAIAETKTGLTGGDALVKFLEARVLPSLQTELVA